MGIILPIRYFKIYHIKYPFNLYTYVCRYSYIIERKTPDKNFRCSNNMGIGTY